MKRFFGVAKYEFKMSIRRPGFWLVYGLLMAFYLAVGILPDGESNPVTVDQIWSQAGHYVFMLNIFTPLLAGILSADRMQRDFLSGVNELQKSTSLPLPAYILAKYLGVLASVLAPMFITVLLMGVISTAAGLVPVQMLWPLLLAFLSIAVPSHAFVVAFSLACPLIMPLRVYQVLFTGYWFWGNMLSPQALPTISDTLLNAVGQYPLQAFFNVVTDSTHAVEADAFTRAEAWLNLLVLAVCAALVLIVTGMYLNRKARNA